VIPPKTNTPSMAAMTISCVENKRVPRELPPVQGNSIPHPSDLRFPPCPRSATGPPVAARSPPCPAPCHPSPSRHQPSTINHQLSRTAPDARPEGPERAVCCIRMGKGRTSRRDVPTTPTGSLSFH
jgi:hypothetical protein